MRILVRFNGRTDHRCLLCCLFLCLFLWTCTIMISFTVAMFALVWNWRQYLEMNFDLCTALLVGCIAQQPCQRKARINSWQCLKWTYLFRYVSTLSIYLPGILLYSCWNISSSQYAFVNIIRTPQIWSVDNLSDYIVVEGLDLFLLN